MANKNMASYVADELVNKIKYLEYALNQATHAVTLLEFENDRLKSLLDMLDDSSSKTNENVACV